MFERLLKRFTTEDTKLVLAAMEKCYEIDNPSSIMIEAVRDMCDSVAVSSGSIVQVIILRAARKRLAASRARRRHASNARTIAGQILMGEKFEAPIAAKTTTPTQHVHAGVVAQQQLAAQQGMYLAAQQGMSNAYNLSAY